jgi:hypothetical protein
MTDSPGGIQSTIFEHVMYQEPWLWSEHAQNVLPLHVITRFLVWIMNMSPHAFFECLGDTALRTIPHDLLPCLRDYLSSLLHLSLCLLALSPLGGDPTVTVPKGMSMVRAMAAPTLSSTVMSSGYTSLWLTTAKTGFISFQVISLWPDTSKPSPSFHAWY